MARRDYAAERIGETRTMKNGKEATIIAYRSSADIDVEFKGLQVVRPNVTYRNFKIGNIALYKTEQPNYIGEVQYQKSYGMNATIIAGDKASDLTVRFDDGVIKKHVSHDWFKNMMWNIPDRDVYKNSKCKEIGVRLYRLRHYNLPELKDGNSINYKLTKSSNYYISKLGIIDCKDELIDILRSNNITVSDTFIDFNRDVDTIIDAYKNMCVDYYENQHIGERVFNKKSNQYMTLIKYRNYEDIDVQFDDGKCRHGMNYDKFKNGTIRHPDFLSDSLAEQRIGEVSTNTHGQEMKVLNYRASEDIDVLFTATGNVRKNVRYAEFKKGNLTDPKETRKARKKK